MCERAVTNRQGEGAGPPGGFSFVQLSGFTSLSYSEMRLWADLWLLPPCRPLAGAAVQHGRRFGTPGAPRGSNNASPDVSAAPRSRIHPRTCDKSVFFPSWTSYYSGQAVHSARL